ncbi:MAG: ABC transporter ATP-binding protein [Spirochaetales bacterium]|nr:ABC transporter ATP-binding protein [Spirochaetales bacterium]
MSGTAIELYETAFSYGQKPVFTDVSGKINRGEVVCLLGANGCGKTTLMKCMNGLLTFGSGKAFIFGKDLYSLNSKDLAMKSAFVFQGYSQVFSYSVTDIVLTGRGPHLGFFSFPGKADKQKALSILENMHISHLSSRYFPTLSGGEQQLIMIARALAQEPSILFLDEPASALDFGNQQYLLRTIKSLADVYGITIVMSTHYPNHALTVADKIWAMKDGRIISSGSPLEVLTEENIYKLYKVPARVVEVRESGINSFAVIPLDDTTGDKEDYFIPAGKGKQNEQCKM